MGLKRKLSFEEPFSSSPPPLTPATSISPSSHGSPSQLGAGYGTRTPLNAWNIAGTPYFNLRTRKRFRDNRPSEETIHERTLQKLFSAQKTLQPGVVSCHVDTLPQTTLQEATPDTLCHSEYDTDGQLISGPALRVEPPRERNQRSIDGFFSTQRSSSSSTGINKNGTMLQPPLISSIYSHAPTLPSVLTCEDCYAPLTKSSGEAVDAEMLDVDMLADLVNPKPIKDGSARFAPRWYATLAPSEVITEYASSVQCQVVEDMKSGDSIRGGGLAALDGCEEWGVQALLPGHELWHF